MKYKGKVFKYKLVFETCGVWFYFWGNDSFKGLDKVGA